MNEPNAQEEKEKNSYIEYANLQIPCDRIFHQSMMPSNVMQRILHVDQKQGPEIMASWLQDMCIWLGFSPKAAKLLLREQGPDSHERLRVLIHMNVGVICNVMRK